MKHASTSDAADARHTAMQYRRLAGIPTSGGHRADRILLALADKLEREASEAMRRSYGMACSDDQLFDFSSSRLNPRTIGRDS